MAEIAYSGFEQLILMFFYSIPTQNTVLLILKRELAMTKKTSLFIRFLTNALWVILNLDITHGGPCNYNNLTVGASLWINFLCPGYDYARTK